MSPSEGGYPVPTLDEMAATIRSHWKTHARDLHRDLVRSGELDSRSERKAQETQDAAQSYQRAGLTPADAWEASMREIALSVPR